MSICHLEEKTEPTYETRSSLRWTRPLLCEAKSRVLVLTYIASSLDSSYRERTSLTLGTVAGMQDCYSLHESISVVKV
jgi:hypothetical protein